MSVIASQTTGVSIAYSTVCSGVDQRKHLRLCVIGLCEGNSPVTGEFPAQRASNAENVSISWKQSCVELLLEYSMRIRWIQWLLISWRFASPGNQQQWHLLCRANESMFFRERSSSTCIMFLWNKLVFFVGNCHLALLRASGSIISTSNFGLYAVYIISQSLHTLISFNEILKLNGSRHRAIKI